MLFEMVIRVDDEELGRLLADEPLRYDGVDGGDCLQLMIEVQPSMFGPFPATKDVRPTDFYTVVLAVRRGYQHRVRERLVRIGFTPECGGLHSGPDYAPGSYRDGDAIVCGRCGAHIEGPRVSS